MGANECCREEIEQWEEAKSYFSSRIDEYRASIAEAQEKVNKASEDLALAKQKLESEKRVAGSNTEAIQNAENRVTSRAADLATYAALLLSKGTSMDRFYASWSRVVDNFGFGVKQCKEGYNSGRKCTDTRPECCKPGSAVVANLLSQILQGLDKPKPKDEVSSNLVIEPPVTTVSPTGGQSPSGFVPNVPVLEQPSGGDKPPTVFPKPGPSKPGRPKPGIPPPVGPNTNVPKEVYGPVYGPISGPHVDNKNTFIGGTLLGRDPISLGNVGGKFPKPDLGGGLVRI